MDIIKYPVGHYLNKFMMNQPFSLSRIGDGEVLCMFPNSTVANCDGSKFLKELIEPMKQVFRNQYDYYHCLLGCSFWEQENKFRNFLAETCPDMKFFDGEIWQELSFSGRIAELTEAVSIHDTPIIVGGSHLRNIVFVHGFVHEPIHLITPNVDSFLSFHHIKEQIVDYYLKGYRVFLFSTGYTSKILIDTLYPAIGKDAFLVDTGSVFDPYCGKLSRSGMRKSGYEHFQPYTSLKLK